MQAMYAELKRQGLEIIGVNLGDTPKEVESVIAKSKLTFPMVIDEKGKGETTRFSQEYGVDAIPATYIIGKDGKLIARFFGYDELGIAMVLKKMGIKRK